MRCCPQLDLVGSVQNNALAGGVNPLHRSDWNPGSGYVRIRIPSSWVDSAPPSPRYFARNYPDYGLYLQLTIP